MTQAMESRGKSQGWVCARCGASVSVTVAADPPLGWSRDGANAYCIDCGRARAAEEARAAMPLDTDWETLEHAGAQARIQFELERDPERSDKEIARLCRTSLLAVHNARTRLGADSSDLFVEQAVADAERGQPDPR
jgi:hypothetical protein